MNETPEVPGVRFTREDYARRTASLYDGIADWYVESFWNDDTDMDWIHLCLAALGGRGSVVDVGSGPGNFARFFLRAGHDVTCTDISLQMIHKAASRLPGIKAFVADMRHMPFDRHLFDCVFCAYSINHVLRDEFSDTMREFGRILRSDGVLCLMIKTGSQTYVFSNGIDRSSCGVMCLLSPHELLDAVRDIGVVPNVVQYKTETSRNEFPHDKMLLIGTKVGRCA